MLVNATNLNIQITGNQMIPDDGPRCVGIRLDFQFALNGRFDVDLSLLEQQARISMVQSLYLDLSQPPASPLIVIVNGTLQNITAKPATQGYYQVLCPNPSRMSFLCADATAVIPVQLINIPIAGAVWPTV